MKCICDMTEEDLASAGFMVDWDTSPFYNKFGVQSFLLMQQSSNSINASSSSYIVGDLAKATRPCIKPAMQFEGQRETCSTIIVLVADV